MTNQQEPSPTDTWKWDRKLAIALPKRPKPPHLYHMTDKRKILLDLNQKIQTRQAEGKVLSTREISNRIRTDWRNMTKEEKQKYIQMHQKDKKRYQAQMKEWDEKGYFTLQSGVSSRVIKNPPIYESRPTKIQKTPMPKPRGKRPAKPGKLIE